MKPSGIEKQVLKDFADFTLEQTQPVIDELVKALETALETLDKEGYIMTEVFLKQTLSKHKKK